jgi:group II intron reverse transcriptase/maturase
MSYYFLNIIGQASLGISERELLNLAYWSKAVVRLTSYIESPLQCLLSMVRPEWAEVVLPEPSTNGGQLCYYRLSGLLVFLARRGAKEDNRTRLEMYQIKVDKQQPKDGYKFCTGTIGWPTGGNSYGHRGLIVPVQLGRGLASHAHIKKAYCTDVHNKVSTSRHERLADHCQNNVGNTIKWDLYRILSKPEFLELCYDRIKSKPGNMIPGVVPDTLDGVSYEFFLTLSQQLKDETFQFKPGRRVHIPKASGGLRPLTIAPPRDKVVQEAIRLILELVYEPEFSTLNVSHGFRPNLSCHTALNDINIKFASVVWIIEGDITKCFDTIDHKILMTLIESKVSDRQFTKLIRKALKAGYMEATQYSSNIVGTPQGSVVSPLLSNIYLHELDKYVMKLKATFDKGKRAKLNNEYTKLVSAAKRAKTKGQMVECKKLVTKARGISSIDRFDTKYRRLLYVRYADDWVIGVRGTVMEAIRIKQMVSDYTNSSLNLTVSREKTRITNLGTDKALFLGANIFRARHPKYHGYRGKGVQTLRRSTKRLQFHVPMGLVRKKLQSAGFLRDNTSHPKFIWMTKEHAKIVAMYNAVYAGYTNYYSFAGNYSQFISFLHHTLRFSLAKLLAAKYSTGVAKVFKKYGKDLRPNKEGRGFTKAEYGYTGLFTRGRVRTLVPLFHDGENQG